MITEDYCSFEVAKLLKEKGFPLPSTNFKDWVCCMYDENGDTQWGCYHPNWYVRVTHQMALKWLREVHNICIVIQPYDSYYKERYEFEINKKNNNDFTWEWISDIENTIFDTYEEAVEAAIKYCLTNLIK